MMKYYKLSEVTEIIMGQAPPGESYNEEGLGVPLIGGAADLGDNYPNPKKYTTASSKLSKTGDIIMCIRATIGDLNWADKEYALGRGVAAFRVTEKISASYLYFWLLSQKQHFLGMGKGATFLQITKKDIEDTIIPLVDIGKQKQIGNILAKAQTLIEQRKQAIAKLDELVQAVFIDMFGDIAKNEKEWAQMTIKEVSEHFSDGPFGSNLKSEHYQAEGVRVIRLQNIGIGEFIDNDKAYISEDHYKTIDKHSCFPGDILIATIGNPNLRACILPLDVELAINKADCIRCKVNDKFILNEYLCYLLNSKQFQKMIENLIHGQTRSRISMGQLSLFPIPVPPLSIQKGFAFKVNSIIRSKHDMRMQLQHLESNFQALLQKAFKGELIVKDGVVADERFAAV